MLDLRETSYRDTPKVTPGLGVLTKYKWPDLPEVPPQVVAAPVRRAIPIFFGGDASAKSLISQ